MSATLTLSAVLSCPVFAEGGLIWKNADGKYANGGYCSDVNNLTWTFDDGTVITYGRGSRFCDMHSEITDPEYYLKAVSYYPDEVFQELQKFVNSFDWIHSDELTRAIMVHNRIANGYHGNVYASPENISFPVLMREKGQCRDFSSEFTDLAHFVGLECETYTPSYLHQACLIKINGQWFATDPTSGLPFLSNSNIHPVDYETEYHRWEREEGERWDVYRSENPDSWATRIDEMNKQLATGVITEEQYDIMYEKLIN